MNNSLTIKERKRNYELALNNNRIASGDENINDIEKEYYKFNKNDLKRKQKESKTPKNRYLKLIDNLTGLQFETFTKYLFQCSDVFKETFATKKSNDFGIDVICDKSIGIQCKHHKSKDIKVGYHAIAETVSGLIYYGLTQGIVITNSYYSKPAIKAADKEGIILFNRSDIVHCILKDLPKKNKSKFNYFIHKLNDHTGTYDPNMPICL